MTCMCFYLCRAHEILCRGHDIPCLGHEILSRGHEMNKWRAQDTMSWSPVTKSWPRDNIIHCISNLQHEKFHNKLPKNKNENK
jgi:hypothetical protein